MLVFILNIIRFDVFCHTRDFFDKSTTKWILYIDNHLLKEFFMKKIICLLAVVFSLFYVQNVAAQFFSLSGGGVYAKYFGQRGDYPLVKPNMYPGTYGVKIRGTYGGFGDYKNAISGGIAYFLPTKAIDLSYGGATLKGSTIEFEVNYNRYLRGRYTDDALNVYAIGGVSGAITMFNYDVPEPAYINPAELKYFKDETTLFVYGNIGIGAEYPVSSFYVFAEAKAAIHMNAYVGGTTIFQNNLLYWGGATLGVRYPFLPKRPSNR